MTHCILGVIRLLFTLILDSEGARFQYVSLRHKKAGVAAPAFHETRGYWSPARISKVEVKLR